MDRGRQLIRQWKLLQILECLRAGATLQALHERIDEPCVERTLRRDLEALQAAGFPIRNEDGRWRLERKGAGAWSVPVQPTMVIGLLVAEHLLEGSPLAGSLRDLRGRVEALLTPGGRSWCQRLGRRFAVAQPAPVRVRDEVEEAVDRAIQESRRLRIRYWSASSGETLRTIEPLILWHAQGGVYVYGWDDRSGERRMFALQRIRQAEVLDDRFESDPDVDAAAHLRNAFHVMTGPVHRMEIWFSPRVAHLLRERAWHPSQRLEEAGGGGVRATFTMAGLPEVARWLAGFGGDARVIAPLTLAREVEELHRAGLEASAGLAELSGSRHAVR